MKFEDIKFEPYIATNPLGDKKELMDATVHFKNGYSVYIWGKEDDWKCEILRGDEQTPLPHKNKTSFWYRTNDQLMEILTAVEEADYNTFILGKIKNAIENMKPIREWWDVYIAKQPSMGLAMDYTDLMSGVDEVFKLCNELKFCSR